MQATLPTNETQISGSVTRYYDAKLVALFNPKMFNEVVV